MTAKYSKSKQNLQPPMNLGYNGRIKAIVLFSCIILSKLYTKAFTVFGSHENHQVSLHYHEEIGIYTGDLSGLSILLTSI